jgi:hypothetical protein
MARRFFHRSFHQLVGKLKDLTVLEAILLTLIILTLALGPYTLFPQSRQPLASSETRFVETSPSGMQIVPASCPSAPHYDGECSGGPLTPPGNTCAIVADPSTVTPGGQLTLTWAAGEYTSSWAFTSPGPYPPTSASLTTQYWNPNYDWGWNSNKYGAWECANPSACYPQSVPTSGSMVVSPTQNTRYLLFETYNDIPNAPWPPTISCTAQVYVSQCPAGQHIDASGVVGGSDKGVIPGDQGASPSNPICLCDTTNAPPVNGQCIPPQTCPMGQHFAKDGTTCLCDNTSAPPVGGMCTVASCRGYYCSGNDLYYNHASGAQCVDDLIQHCTFGCSGAACLPPLRPTASISAKPSIVKEGNTTQVTWSSTNTSSCTVTGNDGDSWSGTTGTQTSKPLLAQTTFTLLCTGIDGSTISAKAVVDVIPKWQEQ